MTNGHILPFFNIVLNMIQTCNVDIKFLSI